MKSLLASARSLSGLDRVDRGVRAFEEEWQQHGEVSLERFWTNCRGRGNQDESDDLVLLGALIKVDLRCRFELGQAPAVDHYLARFPDLMGTDSRVVSLIYEEFCLLEEHGKTADVEGFCDRYPAWRDSLVSQLQYHRHFSQAVGLRAPGPEYPEPGELFEEFQLASMIGRGGSSRVYLAHDLSLGGKRVVLKISPDRGQEPKTQGALDHPHIVPVHSVSFQPDRCLRGLSMPYRPGLPLDEIVKMVCPQTRPRAAKILWDVLIEGTSPDLMPLSADQCKSRQESGPSCDGWKGFPIRGTYSQGVAWIGLLLARTLSYAHRMQTYHRDVKPGNVLITLDHGPQLLDFNLAESPHSSQRAESAMLGGTLPYMAPEQIQAFLNPDLWGTVGARADIYSLGLVLRELLTGQAPDVPVDKLPPARAMQELLDRRAIMPTNVRVQNSEIPHALEAIVQRCLMFDPQKRYPDSQALSSDLECFLGRKPLRHAVNSSRRERVENWVARNHRSMVGFGVTIGLGVFVGYFSAPTIKGFTQPPRPELESLSSFKQAVRFLLEDHQSQAVEPLRVLATDYPDHPLPSVLLGLALAGSNAHLVENDAQAAFRKGMETPSSEPLVRDWARSNPGLCNNLLDFAQFQFDRLKLYESSRSSAKNPLARGAEDQSDVTSRRKHYEALSQALKLALDIDPASVRAADQLGRVEEYFQDFESAYQRLTKLVEEPRDRLAGAELINRTAHRGRVAVLWAAQLRRKDDPRAQERALGLLRQNAECLQNCEALALGIGRNDSEPPEHSEIVRHYFWITAETWLAIGETKQNQLPKTDAAHAFLNAKNAIDYLIALARLRAVRLSPRVDDLRTRLRAGLRDTMASRNPPG